MAAFELNEKEKNIEDSDFDCSNNGKVKQEPIVTLKIYDSCRRQDCLTPHQIGVARAAENGCIGDEHFKERDILTPPSIVASVSVDRLRVDKIIILEKEPNPFKNGYWDIDLKYIFKYRLTFREADGCIVGSIKAYSVYNKRVTLFGSIGTDLVVASDIYSNYSREDKVMDADPFVIVEAKPVALEVKLKHRRYLNEEEILIEPNEVLITLGLFSIIKIVRLVDLCVESQGFAVAPACEDTAPLNPCEFFDNLDFPLDIFSPPQKKEFLSGISSNIRKEDK